MSLATVRFYFIKLQLLEMGLTSEAESLSDLYAPKSEDSEKTAEADLEATLKVCACVFVLDC